MFSICYIVFSLVITVNAEEAAAKQPVQATLPVEQPLPLSMTEEKKGAQAVNAAPAPAAKLDAASRAAVLAELAKLGKPPAVPAVHEVPPVKEELLPASKKGDPGVEERANAKLAAAPQLQVPETVPAPVKGSAQDESPDREEDNSEDDRKEDDEGEGEEDDEPQGDGEEKAPRKRKKENEAAAGVDATEEAKEADQTGEVAVMHFDPPKDVQEPSPHSLTMLPLAAALLSFAGVVAYSVVIVFKVCRRKREAKWGQTKSKAGPSRDDLDFEFEDIELAMNVGTPTTAASTPVARKSVQSHEEMEATLSGWDNDVMSDAGWADNAWDNDGWECDSDLDEHAAQPETLDNTLIDAAIASGSTSSAMAPPKGKAD